MKRQISVSIFLAILVIALAWLYIKFNNETNPKENTITTENHILDEPATTISQEYFSYKYYIKVEHEKLVVYKSKNHGIFMETSIEKDMLPQDVQERLKIGIFFESEEELYDFLESYSS
jgi:hypothetical protein